MPDSPRRSRGIRPSTTRSTAALWAKSLLNAALFFAIFMGLLPWLGHRWLPAPLPIPRAVGAWGGGLLCAAGIVVWVYCLDVFSRRGAGTPFPLDAPRRLATTGPFGVVRNPIMAAELSVVWGEALWLSSLGVALYALLLSIAAYVVVVRVEEPELRERFGEEYESYARRVPRWLPRLRRRDQLSRSGAPPS
jgi:protein-S-isoprenylcysteine O-methyltransferase Ste14